MSNTHLLPDTYHEMMARDGDLLPACVLSETWPNPSASMTLAPFPTYAYVQRGTPTQLVYVNQPAESVVLTGADANYWLAIHADTHTTVAGWTREPGSHYLWQANALQPNDPPGGLVFAGLTVAGSAITAVNTNLHGVPRGKVAFGGDTGALTFDPAFTFDNVSKQVGAPTYFAPEYAGDNRIGFYTTLMEAGGTNRWAFYAGGNAPLHFGGWLQSTAWAGFQQGVSVGAQTAPATPRILDVWGHAYISGVAGIGIGPLPGEFQLNTLAIKATALTIDTIAAGGIIVSGTITANEASVAVRVTTGEVVAGGRVLAQRLGLAGGNPGEAFTLFSAGGVHQFNGITGIGRAADPSWSLAVGNIVADTEGNFGTLTVRTGATLAAATVTGALTIGSANVTGTLGVGGAATVTGDLGVGGGVTVTGNLSASIGAFGTGAQPGYFLTSTNLYTGAASVNGTLGVTGTLNVTGNTSLGNDLFVTNRVGIGVSPVAGFHLTLGGSGAQKPGGGPFSDSSSRTMKRNIQRIPNALPLLLEQRGCMYEWQEATRAALLPGTRYGLVAEEVTLPQWRQELDDGTVAIAANGFEALCIESLREIVTRLEALEHARTD